MKRLFRAYPDLSRLIMGAILLALALIGSGFIHIPYLPAGLLLVILVNWLMFRTEGKNLNALGFNVHPKQLTLAPLGLILGIGSFLLSFYVGTVLWGGRIITNPDFHVSDLFVKFWQVLPTTAVQDFIIVGYCFYKMVQLTNKRIAILVFGIFFIMLHDVWNGNLVNTFYYASTIFIGYMLFSTSILRSGTIWLPIGIHWGNNFVNSSVFTFQKTPTSWLYIVDVPYVQHPTFGDAVKLFVAANIGAVVAMAIVMTVWRRNRLLLGN